MDELFYELENNAFYRNQLISLQACDILETCLTKGDVAYLLGMIDAFLDMDNFLILDKKLLYKIQLLMNLINVKTIYSTLKEETSIITSKIDEILKNYNTLQLQLSFAERYYIRYSYKRNIFFTHIQMIKNLTEHYEAIQDIKKLTPPVDHFGKFSFLEMMNITMTHYNMHKRSYELKDYYFDCLDYFKYCTKEEEATKEYKKYLSMTKRNLKSR